jgi:hypothetical protein
MKYSYSQDVFSRKPKPISLVKSRFFYILVASLFLISSVKVIAQELYSARGYWEESTKPTYRNILIKQSQADSLTNDEKTYLRDYQTYLQTYFDKLSPAEKQKFAQMKDTWDKELAPGAQPPVATTQNREGDQEYEWRTRDRAANAFYGIVYGSSLVAAFEIDGAAAAGIPLIMGGAWLLGPVINKKKYDGISTTTIRASNTGKLFGLGYGAALGMAIEGDDPDGRLTPFIATVSSITLGEVGFHLQKKKNLSAGHVEMLRHYLLLGPWTALAANVALTNEQSTTAIGLTLVGGGVAGILVGDKQAKRYDYTRGDVDAMSSFSLLTTAMGFAVVIELIDNDVDDALVLIPAASTIAGTIIGQKMVRGVHLSNKQGSLVNLTAAGSALIGLGILAIAEAESPTAYFAVPGVLGLIGHQVAFSSFKKENLLKSTQGSLRKRNDFRLSFNVTPENYFINQKIDGTERSRRFTSSVSNPIVSLKLKF